MATPQFERKMITLTNDDGSTAECRAACLGGLAYHEMDDAPDWYTITHIASGRALRHYLTLREVQQAIIAGAPLMDWTQDEARLRTHPIKLKRAGRAMWRKVAEIRGAGHYIVFA